MNEKDLVNVLKQDIEDLEETIMLLREELSEAYEGICSHCMDFPCQEERCYWYNKMNKGATL